MDALHKRNTTAVRPGLARLLAITLLSCAGPLCAADDVDPLAKLANMSLEELMNTPVVSVAGRPAARIATPAAVTVLSSEDIRRNGHRTVAEALRMVPGMFVGRINSGSWVVGARGLTGSSLTATRYLVLIDGRLVYDPLISTTFWDVVDVPLADVDRIEVVRGPGATLWGVNAMNGVVNIITRRAADTPGTLVQLGAGSNDEHGLYVRHGAAIDGDTAYRVWAKYDGHGDFEDPSGASIVDQWSSLHGGFRLDGRLTADTLYTFQGDAYTHPQAMESVRLPVPGRDREFEQRTRDDTVDGANLLFRALNGFGQDRGWLLRAYVDHTRRDTARFGVRRDTANVEYRRWLQWNDANNLIWGLQYDWTRDDVDNGPVLQFTPHARAWSTLNAFVQNTTELVDDRLFLMLGTKLTHHSFAGLQTQPSVRLWWTPSERQTWWAAVSRPVRVPSRFEEDGLLVFSYVDRGVVTTGTPDGVILPLGLAGDEDLRPEKLLAWELGHRIQANDAWAIDTTLFYNHYQRLIGVPPAIFGRFTDASSGATWGGELSVSGRLSDRWRVEASYSRLHTRIDGPVLRFDETSTPRMLAQLHSYFDIGEHVELNTAFYRVGEIPFQRIDAYTRADLGITWRPSAGIEWSLWGQNLLDAQHSESSGAQVPRSIYAQVSFDLER
jgi:iron complex outermembrane receptor protein